MKNLAVFVFSLTIAVICITEPVGAQSDAASHAPDAPIIPIDIRFRHTSQYFMQRIGDDSRYSEIEAALDPDNTEVILTDKATEKRISYSSSQHRVDVLHAHGADAYFASIQVHDSVVHNSVMDTCTLYWIQLHDNFGQEISWHFVVDESVPKIWPGVTSRPNEQGVLWVYARRQAAPGPDTVVNIGGKEHPVLATTPDDGNQALYAEDLTFAEILSGQQVWSIERNPVKISEGAQWNLKSASGLERKLTVKSIFQDGLSIEQVDQDGPDTASMLFDLETTKDGYSLRSVSLAANSNKFWIFFGPGLPLPSHKSGDERDITFSIAEDEQAGIARGNVAVHRFAEGESVNWTFENPESLRSSGFVTTVNVIWGKVVTNSGFILTEGKLRDVEGP